MLNIFLIDFNNKIISFYNIEKNNCCPYIIKCLKKSQNEIFEKNEDNRCIFKKLYLKNVFGLNNIQDFNEVFDNKILGDHMRMKNKYYIINKSEIGNNYNIFSTNEKYIDTSSIDWTYLLNNNNNKEKIKIYLNNKFFINKSYILII